MPFKPRLIAHEAAPLDEQGELLLPDDLALLSEQLSEDAQHLAASYPACAAGNVRAAAVGNALRDVPVALHDAATANVQSRSSWRPLRPVLYVMSGSLAALVLAITLALQATPTPRSADARQQSERPPATPRATAASVAASTITSIAPADPMSAAILRDVSRPELEGLIDLWQRQSPKVASISF